MFIEFYAVLAIGYGSSHDGSTSLERTYTASTRDAQSVTYGLNLGARYGLWAGEIGYLSLPKYHAYAQANDPPRSATQDITGRALFARALIQAPQTWKVQPYAFLGAARVNGKNREQGQCATCGAAYVPDWHSETSATVPYYGAGLSVPLGTHWAARAEFGMLPKAVDSYWTGRRDYRIGTIGVSYRF
jgi:hypothetical protein